MTKSQAQEMAQPLWEELRRSDNGTDERVQALVQQIVHAYQLPEPRAGDSPIEVPAGDDGVNAVVLQPDDGRYLPFAGQIERDDQRRFAAMTRDGRPALLKGDDPLAGAFRGVRRLGAIRS